MQADSLSPQCLWQSRSHIIKRVPISYRTLWAPETVDATLEHSTRYLIWTNLQIRTGNPVLSGILALHEAMTMPLGKLYPPALLPEAKALAHTALSQAETPRPLGYHSCSVSTPALQKSNRHDASVSRQSAGRALARTASMNLIMFYCPGSTSSEWASWGSILLLWSMTSHALV